MNRRVSRVQMAIPEEELPEVKPVERSLTDWVQQLKKFTAENKEKCNLDAVPPPPKKVQKKFSTGSLYEGTWDLLGMNGRGTYSMSNGTVYTGEFKEGLFHGTGELQFANGVILEGIFNEGVITERTLIFDEGLEYSEQDWMYCQMPDRRFTIEYENELQPGGKTFLTADQPTIEVPDGMYDTGDGFYDPQNTTVYRLDDFGNSSIVRSPGVLEQKWIVNNCRTSPDGPVGPHDELYENWQEPEVNPEPPPPPAATTTAIRAQDYGSWESIDDRDFYVVMRKSRTSFVSGRSQGSLKHKCARLSHASGSRRTSIFKTTKSQHFRWQT